MNQLPETGFLRLSQIIGQRGITEDEAEINRKRDSGPKRPRKAIPAIFPIGKTKWWEGVRAGKYPQPVRTLGLRITAWSVESIRALVTESSKDSSQGAK